MTHETLASQDPRSHNQWAMRNKQAIIAYKTSKADGSKMQAW